MADLKFRTPLNLMNKDQKSWFATAMVAMVLADGTVTKEEAETLMISISFVQDDRLLETLKKYVRHQTAPTLGTFKGWDKEVKYRAMMMLDLMAVAIADRDLSDTERDQFLQIGKLLGIPAAKVMELIEIGEKSIEGT